ncbi:hypothetical protein GPECTOR_173g203 [Gonium pectorale]|uniref:Uncharacterized protein n=1 Tax=Gonium pectorale TaxID=33097 RepID=A0A150FXF5_GONPE|nr:hypothetical protein GPECTOR_173g203 [Gonium pectorale]|eukprot:KXZ42257.1 hypothetical protein GPECTOR_173g203 [Gonium pectorale]
MQYDTLVIVEEDLIVHRHAVNVIARSVQEYVNDKEVGLISSIDVDNSVFGMHRLRWEAVRADMLDYFGVIKGGNYADIDLPPLVDKVRALFREKGHDPVELSQDQFLVKSLRKFLEAKFNGMEIVHDLRHKAEHLQYMGALMAQSLRDGAE